MEWSIQRTAWACLYALLVGIACGLLGQGPLARARAGRVDTAELEYQRFRTAKSSMELSFTLPPSAGEVQLQLSGDYLQQVELRRVMPEPVRTVLKSDGLVFVFSTNAQQQVRVRFLVEPQTFGLLEGWFSSGAGAKSRFWQFIYP